MSFIGKFKSEKKSFYDVPGRREVLQEGAHVPEVTTLVGATDVPQNLDRPSMSTLSDEDFAKLLQMEEDENYNPFADSYLPLYPSNSQPFEQSAALSSSFSETIKGKEVDTPSTINRQRIEPYSSIVVP